MAPMALDELAQHGFVRIEDEIRALARRNGSRPRIRRRCGRGAACRR
jgi:hypothetical protein